MENLIALADLESARAAAIAANAALGFNWQFVKRWSEQDRYRIKSETEARDLVSAVTDSTNRVFPWIKGHW